MRQLVENVMKISFVLYLAILFLLLFVRQRGMIWSGMTMWQYAQMHGNLIPFRTILEYIKAIADGSMNLNIPLENLLGNLLLFFPMGIYLPYFYKNADTMRKFLSIMLILVLLVETIQFATKTGAFDIDDILLNLTGAAAGYLLWRQLKKYREPHS